MECCNAPHVRTLVAALSPMGHRRERGKMVGLVRFELTTSCTPCKRATRLRYSPNKEGSQSGMPRTVASAFSDVSPQRRRGAGKIFGIGIFSKKALRGIDLCVSAPLR